MEPFSKKPRAPRKKFRTVSFGWILPNMLTIGGLVSGLTAFRFALDQNWSLVVAMVSLAAIFDALDGRMARLLKTTSVFGAELDSLSDAIVFGVIPALCCISGRSKIPAISRGEQHFSMSYVSY